MENAEKLLRELERTIDASMQRYMTLLGSAQYEEAEYVSCAISNLFASLCNLMHVMSEEEDWRR